MKFHPSDLFVFLETSNNIFDIPDVMFTSFAECEEFAKSQEISGNVMSLSEALDKVYEFFRSTLLEPLCTVCGKPNCQFSYHTYEDIQLIHELQNLSRAQLQFKILELTHDIQAIYEEQAGEDL